jgi:hypothetical protein
MFGRYPDGQPLERPNSPNPNDFTYAQDARGARCPLGAHIRRANPRLGGEHRLLRRGMPYVVDDPGKARKGIYFVALNANIENQFEFLQRTWINGPPRDGSNGTDPIAACGRTERRMVVEGDQHTDRSPQLLLGIPEFVTSRGGQYYFMPGIAGLGHLCDASQALVRKPAQVEPRSPSDIPIVPLRKKIAITVRELLGLREAIRWRWAKVGEGGLYTREFTAMLGVAGDAEKLRELRELLEKENSARDPANLRLPSKRYNIAYIQSLRWVLFQPTRDANTPADPPGQTEPWVLVLSFVFDGEPDDALAEFIALADPRRILTHCQHFDSTTDIAKYLKHHRVESGFLFRDLGPLRAKGRPGSFVVDATRDEIEDAVQLQSDFESFYSNDTGPNGRAGRFLRNFEDRSRLVPLTRFERRLPDEARWIRRLSELSMSAQTFFAAARKDKTRHRGAHAKGHCLLEGKLLVVEPKLAQCKQGLFAEPKKNFDVQVRLSNGSPETRSDRKNDARGLSIRVKVGNRASPYLPYPTTAPDVQDFILFSDPVFFAKDLRQFTTIFGILATRPLVAQLKRLAGFLVKAWTLKPLLLAGRVLFRKPIGHPLAIAYHSATPYMLGEDLVVKYSVEAVGREAFAKLAKGAGDDFLRQAVTGGPDSPPIRLKFFVHVLPKLSPEKARDIVEDATTDWETLGAERVEVAELELRPVDPNSNADLEDAERMAFNPWNGLVAHRPLGSLNRARLTAYHDSATFRDAEVIARRTTPPDAESGEQAAE